MPIPIHLINADLEAAVLGRMLNEPELAATTGDTSADVFTAGRHRIVFDAIQHVAKSGRTITVTSVAEDLHRRGALAEIGGLTDGIVPLIEARFLAADFDLCLNKLAELALHRSALTDLYKAVQKLESPGSTIEDFQEVGEIARRAETSGGHGAPRLRTVAEVVREYPGGLNAFLRPSVGDGYMRFPWGMAQRAIGGLWPGEVLVIGGRPGAGKSAAGLQLARYNTQFGLTPGMYNLEMSDQQTIYRTVCARAGVPMSRFRQGECTDDELRAINRELGKFNSEGILLCDRATMTIGQIRKSLRHAVKRSGVKMAVLDYLQLAEAGIKTDSRTQEVSHISRQVKLMARELNIPVVVLAQLRRSDSPNQEPTLSDLRESGAIEQDADVVMFCHKKTEQVAGQQADRYSLLFPKVRNGQQGFCRVHFDTRALEFRDMASEE